MALDELLSETVNRDGVSPANQHGQGSFPLQKGMSLSHWQQTKRNSPLLDARTTEMLPERADVIIVGSGVGKAACSIAHSAQLSGAVTALRLLESPQRPSSIVMLEARELCSGATGKNAGHCKPDTWKGFTKYSKLYGPKESLRILANERETWAALVDYVKTYKVDCDLWVGKTLDVMMDDESLQASLDNYAAFEAAGGDTSLVQVTDEALAAEKVSRLSGAKAVFASDASTLHPLKLVIHIIQRCLNVGLNLQTWTPATSIIQSGELWVVHTDRGAISAPTVIHCTNAFAATLLPETKMGITPTPHMCNRTVPPTSFAGSLALQNSYGVVFKDGSYSINPRTTSDGFVLFGGTPHNINKLDKYVRKDLRRKVDDSLVNFDPITASVKHLTGKHFGWDVQEKGNPPRYDYAWSGIIGFSADEVPFVGSVPGKPGQWMSCGHNGHGMARIFTCSTALANLVLGKSWTEVNLPDSFRVTRSRLDRTPSREANL